VSRKRCSKQQVAKRLAKCCFFCKEPGYAALAAHRLLPGEKGGKYHLLNILPVCANCHCKIHNNEISIDERKYLSTAGVHLIHYWKDGIEFWEPER
jgi:hypothetical protein